MIDHLMEKIKEDSIIIPNQSYGKLYDLDVGPASIHLLKLFIKDLQFLYCSVNDHMTAYKIVIGKWFFDTNYDKYLHFDEFSIHVCMRDETITIKGIHLFAN